MRQSIKTTLAATGLLLSLGAGAFAADSPSGTMAPQQRATDQRAGTSTTTPATPATPANPASPSQANRTTPATPATPAAPASPTQANRTTPATPANPGGSATGQVQRQGTGSAHQGTAAERHGGTTRDQRSQVTPATPAAPATPASPSGSSAR